MLPYLRKCMHRLLRLNITMKKVILIDFADQTEMSELLLCLLHEGIAHNVLNA